LGQQGTPPAKEIFSLAILDMRAIGLAALMFLPSFTVTSHLITATESHMTDRHTCSAGVRDVSKRHLHSTFKSTGLQAAEQ